jgi:hypothetical protein
VVLCLFLIDGVRDSKDYGVINHFEIPPSGIQTYVIGITKKDTHTLDYDVTLATGYKRLKPNFVRILVIQRSRSITTLASFGFP